MKQSFWNNLLKCSTCFFLSIGVFYAYLEEQNAYTRLRIQIPKMQKALSVLEEENARLIFEIDQFEHPANLKDLRKHIEFFHLKYPVSDKIFVIHKDLQNPLEGHVLLKSPWNTQTIMGARCEQ